MERRSHYKSHMQQRGPEDRELGQGGLNEASLPVVVVAESRLQRGEQETDMVNEATLKKFGKRRETRLIGN